MKVNQYCFSAAIAEVIRKEFRNIGEMFTPYLQGANNLLDTYYQFPLKLPYGLWKSGRGKKRIYPRTALLAIIFIGG